MQPIARQFVVLELEGLCRCYSIKNMRADSQIQPHHFSQIQRAKICSFAKTMSPFMERVGQGIRAWLLLS